MSLKLKIFCCPNNWFFRDGGKDSCKGDSGGKATTIIIMRFQTQILARFHAQSSKYQDISSFTLFQVPSWSDRGTEGLCWWAWCLQASHAASQDSLASTIASPPRQTGYHIKPTVVSTELDKERELTVTVFHDELEIYCYTMKDLTF